MSYYVTPFLILNLGSEMVFVVAQRLQAQHVAIDKSTLVLDEIISALISSKLMTELMKPQATYNHEAVQDIIEDITQCSAMRLDTVSMGKLWDLITMVFKWQSTVCDDIIKITLRHLYEIETYTTNPDTQLQLHKIQNLVDNFNKILSRKEKIDLRDDILYWLNVSNVRVSLLLRMGLQKLDGSFETQNLNPIADEMLRNLGENIYAVTKNGKILEQRSNNNNNHNNNNNNRAQINNQPEVPELQEFVEEMLGGKRTESTGNKVLRLAIDDRNFDGGSQESVGFSEIEVTSEGTTQIDQITAEISNDNDEEYSFKNELLDMIGGEDFMNENQV